MEATEAISECGVVLRSGPIAMRRRPDTGRNLGAHPGVVLVPFWRRPAAAYNAAVTRTHRINKLSPQPRDNQMLGAAVLTPGLPQRRMTAYHILPPAPDGNQNADRLLEGSVQATGVRAGNSVHHPVPKRLHLAPWNMLSMHAHTARLVSTLPSSNHTPDSRHKQ